MLKKLKLSEGDYRDLVFMAISVMVIGEFALASTHIDVIKSSPIEWWVAMPFATVMLARTITFYGVAKWIRRWFVVEEPDSCHAGSNNEPKKGLVEPLGWLVACPICTGMHSASFLVLMRAFFPDFGWTMTVMLAIAAESMLLQHTAELLSWAGRFMRVMSGFISPDPGTPGYKARDGIYRILEHWDDVEPTPSPKEVEENELLDPWLRFKNLPKDGWSGIGEFDEDLSDILKDK